MPSVSRAQHNAMQAAAHGRSTLDIPKSVGQDFVRADKLESMTGLPLGKKKTRRGKRRSASAHAEHLEHMAEMKRCAECGDHKGAKNAAFRFIKALPGDEPEMEHNAAEERGEPKVSRGTSPAKGKLSPALMAYLTKKKSP